MKKLFGWIENFWYHYKWITVIVVAFVAIIAFCLFNRGDGVNDDIQIIYAGPEILTDVEIERMERAFSDVMGKDYNEDGKNSVNIVDITVLSEQQLEEAREEAKKDGESIVYDPTMRTQAVTQVKNLMSTGAVIICLLDPYVYELCQEGTFEKLENVLSTVPEVARDQYAIPFEQTDLAKSFDAFSVFDSELLLCIRTNAVIGTDSKQFQKEYAWHKTYFKDLAEFSV